LFFTPDALAQATSPGLAAYHAERLAPFNSVADLGCGAGMDSIALAAAGARVVAVERDPARLVFARANAAARGVDERITFVTGI
jgi:predicted RNA methylase